VAGAEITLFESITARGVKGCYEGEFYYAGNKKLMDENNIHISASLAEKANAFQKQAKTVVYFADSKQVLSVIAVADQRKATSAKAIKQLQGIGIEVYMLTGDNQQTAASVAGEVGITRYQAEVLPSEKADFAKELQKQ